MEGSFPCEEPVEVNLILRLDFGKISCSRPFLSTTPSFFAFDNR